MGSIIVEQIGVSKWAVFFTENDEDYNTFIRNNGVPVICQTYSHASNLDESFK